MLQDGYLTNCDRLMKRSADYEAAEKATAPFVFCNDEVMGNGNVCGDVFFDEATKIASFRDLDEPYHCSIDQIRLGRAISSPLLMYRLAALFKGTITASGPEGYKVIWEFGLLHQETNTNLWFGEWKGSGLFWTKFQSWSAAPSSFNQDLLRLLTVLVSDTCAHPYDGLVAGSVA